jgi:hypothetical protein
MLAMNEHAEPLEPGRSHSVGAATFLALVIPGAGQAYNGQPIKALFLLLTSALILPWLLSLFDARRVARRLVQGGDAIDGEAVSGCSFTSGSFSTSRA